MTSETSSIAKLSKQERKRANDKRFKENNPEYFTRWHYRNKYGITLEQRDQMLADQDHKCAICRTDTPGGRDQQWHLDHDHITDELRELLCMQCNHLLGNARDNPAILLAAIAYLERHKNGGQEEAA